MGNDNVTPAAYAIKSYDNFITSFMKNEFGNKAELDNFESRVDREFSVFLEDFLVNDKQLQNHNNQGKRIFAGSICFLHSVVPFGSIREVISDKNFIPKFSEFVVKSFNCADPTDKVLSLYLAVKYCWDGTSFHEWSDEKWSPCSEDSINCVDYLKHSGVTCTVKTLGLNSELVVQGVAEISAYCKGLIETVHTFKDTDDFKKAVSDIKSSTKKFNITPNVIPCYSGPIKIGKGSQRAYKRGDYINCRLTYDPKKETTSLVSDYLDNLSCDSKTLATALVSFGVYLKRTLTVILGPAKSGKSTLLQVARALYGPYTCTQSEHKAGNVDYDLVRTCFIDCSSLPSEEELNSYPFNHLVVTCESFTIEGKYDDRQVVTLTLSKSLPEDSVKEGIVANLSTRKQLGSLLGWALQNYDPSSFLNVSLLNLINILEMTNTYLFGMGPDKEVIDSLSKSSDAVPDTTSVKTSSEHDTAK